jgi:glycosyltransferase involved in cell wall biosynthesis
VVIPAFNEQRLIATTIATLPGWVDRVLVIDDGSGDATAAEAHSAGKNRTGFELLSHDRNRGVGAAIATGCRHALELGVDATVVVGADAQMDPNEMTRLLDPLLDGRAEYAKGDRLHWPGVARTMPTVRWIGNWLLTLLTRPVAGCWHVSDSQCGYTALNRKGLQSIPWSQLYPRYGYPNDLLAWCSTLNLRVIDVPVRPIYADEESGIRVGRVVWPLLRLLARIGLRRLRLARARRPDVGLTSPAPLSAPEP